MSDLSLTREPEKVSDFFDGDLESALRRSYFRITGLILFVTACVLVVHFTPLKTLLEDLGVVRSFVSSTGLWAPVIFVAISSVSIFVGAPRLPFCVLGGMLFGFVQGLLLSQLATLFGAYGPYLFARYSTGDWIAGQMKRVGSVADYLAEPTVWNVFLFRQIPIWGVFMNLCLGSIGVSNRTFIVGSLLGFLPQAIVFTLIGSGLVEESLLRALSRLWIAIPILGVAVLVISRSRFRVTSPVSPR